MKKQLIFYFIFIFLFCSIIFLFTQNNIKDININLIDTSENSYLYNNKIAPGSKGNFYINIFSNLNTNYFIYIKNYSNFDFLNFFIDGKKVDNIDNSKLISTGNTQKKLLKSISVSWEWNLDSSIIPNTSDFYLNFQIICKRRFK